LNNFRSESNGSLMRLSIFSVWAINLPKKDLFNGVKLLTMLTHSNQVVIEASQLYCYAITLLIKGYSTKDVIILTKREITILPIKEWFE
jgi:ADP-ribosylglycohydrolase